MQKDHMQQQHQGVQSTKETQQEDNQLILHIPQRQTREISMNVGDMQRIMYTNQTGQFLVVSSQGNLYIMVLCKANDNLMLMESMKNRTSGEMCKAYKQLRSFGITIKKHILDSEALGENLQAIKKGIEYQKVPPNMHRRNAAEKAISTFKNILARVERIFSMHMWDQLLPQAESTLNMMHQTNIAHALTNIINLSSLKKKNNSPHCKNTQVLQQTHTPEQPPAGSPSSVYCPSVNHHQHWQPPKLTGNQTLQEP